MQVHIELPDDISPALQQSWDDLPRRTLEALAIEGYRTGVLTESHVRRMLGYATRLEVHALLKQAGVDLHYTEAEVAEDLEAHRQRGILPAH